LLVPFPFAVLAEPLAFAAASVHVAAFKVVGTLLALGRGMAVDPAERPLTLTKSSVLVVRPVLKVAAVGEVADDVTALVPEVVVGTHIVLFSSSCDSLSRIVRW
jgi:hypothetical protein